MLKYTRNKVVGVHRQGRDVVGVHGVLDDDLYSLELDLLVGLPGLEIQAINGKWHRWTTPECPRSSQFLQEAVGLSMNDEGFSQTVHKVVGRKACRHYANLLLECMHSAREAVLIGDWEEAKAGSPGLTFEDYLAGRSPAKVEAPAKAVSIKASEGLSPADGETRPIIKAGEHNGLILDLHLHSHPASPCSSAPVDRLIAEAKRIGLDGLCLTDHNHVWPPEKVEDLRQKHGFLILRGNEITTGQGDMLVFGLEKDIQGIIPLADLRAEVLRAGGFMIAAHPFRGFLVFGVGEVGLTPEKAMERSLWKYVDALEVLNGKVTARENEFARQVAEGLGLPATGGSDAHDVAEVGQYATVFQGSITNEKELTEALKNGNYAPIHYRSKIESAV
ncbi:MAG: PHP domain-containing protein [Pseudomonadota bacterium]